jgi:hypothetical protein
VPVTCVATGVQYAGAVSIYEGSSSALCLGALQLSTTLSVQAHVNE